MKGKTPAPEPPGNAAAVSIERLVELAKANPFWQFEVDDLARMTNHSPYVLHQMRKANDSPFVSGKCRPERLERWLEKHPGWVPSKV